MTLNEYNKKIDKYEEQLNKSLNRNEWEKTYEELSKFQLSYMQHVLDEYEKSVDSDAKQYIYNLLYHAVMWSETGSSIIDVRTKEIADEIKNVIFDEIGDYLLDYNIYPENDHWVVDCMFGGAYVPYWDGWSKG